MSVPNPIPHKTLYINDYICSCYAFVFIFEFSEYISKHILQFHAFVFYNLLRNVGGNIYNMKNVVEGLKKTSNKEVAKDKTYWFPLSKGFNRLLVVVNCLILVYAVNKYSEKFNTFFFTIFIELVVYITAVWVYRGFREPLKEKDDK